MIGRFVIYGLFGWCMEVFWTGLGSFLKGDIKLTGQTYIWMFFIYGLAIFFEPIHQRIGGLNFILRGGIYTVLIFTVEYCTGWILRRVLGICPWDYSNSNFSVNGLIRLDYTPVWFIAGLLFEKVHYGLETIGRVFNI
ncbi:MAG: putative ABC transporter permease [Maledivibacter sp.]|jgi:uncharacterized membrane protein|nr:putative ABC transporter permease [Maledivibacter sp.]